MNNLVIYNEAEINSVEICVLPPLFKVKVVMDSDTDATVTITDINGAEDFASVCIETNRKELSDVQFTDKERLYIGREVARCIAADIALFVSEWHCADSGFGTSGENTVVCYSVIHLVHTACELHSVQKILQGSEK